MSCPSYLPPLGTAKHLFLTAPLFLFIVSIAKKIPTPLDYWFISTSIII